MKTIICHVSDQKHDVLIPQQPENAICFSENKFITYFGQYLYLFDLETMEKHFNIIKLPTGGICGTCQMSPEASGLDYLRYESQGLGHEWRIYEPVDIHKYCLGIVEHWNHMVGVVGKSGPDIALMEVCVDLLRYNGEIR